VGSVCHNEGVAGDSYDAVIIGGGAAGLMCAIEAGKRGRRVLVIEHNVRAGRKILISGGGRCNFTNRHTRAENFFSANPHFVKSALARYGPEDFVRLVERYRIQYHEKTLGQLFCDRSASDITGMLEAECAAAGVRIETSCKVSRVGRNARFELETSAGAVETESLVIATGGLTVPKIGATAFGYEVARQFGLRVVECRPALTPLLWNREDVGRFGDLAGVSMEVTASCGGQSFREKMLFTHRGLSGPAILQVSSYWRAGQAVTIDLLPGVEAPANLSRVLPRRFAARWTGDDDLHAWRVAPAGLEGYDKAEVTAGGVDTAELSSKTMEAKKVPGLYFIGEVVDVTGQLGGFNFQWAWAAGFSAGQYV